MAIYNAFWVFIWHDRILHSFLMYEPERVGRKMVRYAEVSRKKMG
jgi:hypothetical protein